MDVVLAVARIDALVPAAPEGQQTPRTAACTARLLLCIPTATAALALLAAVAALAAAARVVVRSAAVCAARCRA